MDVCRKGPDIGYRWMRNKSWKKEWWWAPEIPLAISCFLTADSKCLTVCYYNLNPFSVSCQYKQKISELCWSCIILGILRWTYISLNQVWNQCAKTNWCNWYFIHKWTIWNREKKERKAMCGIKWAMVSSLIEMESYCTPSV